MRKIIHITDIHLVPEGQIVVGMDPRQRFEQVIQTINKRHADTDYCIISGDLTDRGDIESYLLLEHLLDNLEVPTGLMLGNHDNRAHFRTVLSGIPVDGAGFVQNVVDFGDLRIILLDTLDDENAGTGILCKHRLAWFSARLAEATSKRICVFMHHPPRSVGLPWFDNMMLEQTDGFWQLIDSNSNIEHIAFGHLHITTTGRWDRVSFSCNRGTCHRIALGFGKDSIEFVNSEPTFDIITISDTGVLIHHTAPIIEEDIIAREYSTADGKGRIELLCRDTRASMVE